MNALQSLSTSGVHARRCSSVPCEKEGVDETVKDSKASNTHHCAKGIGRSVQSFRLSVFIAGLASIIEADARHRHHGRWEYTLVGTCACSETSAFGAFDLAAVLPFHESGSAVHRLKSEAVRSGRVQHRGAQATKSSPVCPSVGNHTSAKHFLLKRCGLIRHCWWGRGNAERIHCASVATGRCCVGPVATLAFRR